MEKEPIPVEHREIARGAGAAAVLLFLHIAAIGYLAFFAYYALTHPKEMGGVLLNPASAMLLYFPAYFAFGSYLPTDKLSRVVGLTAKLVGLFTGSIFVALAVGYAVQVSDDTAKNLVKLCVPLCGGIILAGLVSLLFARLTAPARANFKKNASENELPE